MHRALMPGVMSVLAREGIAGDTHFLEYKSGEFRTETCWYHSKTPTEIPPFMPPGGTALIKALNDFEQFILKQDDIPPVIKAGLLYAQFVSLHPFADGNARVGRMLSMFYLWQVAVISNPILYFSKYFKQHQNLYYQRLIDYRSGLVDEWLGFYLDAVIAITATTLMKYPAYH